MENPAQSSDLTARGWKGDLNVAQTWLDVAWRALRREPSLPGLEERITSGQLDSEDVKDVVIAGALRVLRNPEGFESESGAIDDYQESVKHSDATQDVYFTSAELRRLAPEAYASGGYAGSIKYCG